MWAGVVFDASVITFRATQSPAGNMTRLLVIPLVLTLVGCGDSGTEPLTNDDFAPELNVDLDAMTRTSSGLYLQDLVAGTGDEAVAGVTATVHYEGWLPNGTKFASSRDDNEPLTFSLGPGR